MSQPSRFAILGTAGHIDHGKTSLVRMLTGVDTDRLKEEQERGISIDLGFAHLALPSGISCGLVDVPGHERFVKNMLAGACGVDAVLVAIAADEGVMPQTKEHVDIVRLLGVEKGVVALTKIDMVEAEWVDMVTEEVREYLASVGYGDMPIVPVSSRTQEGKEALLSTIDSILRETEAKTDQDRARLPVDRSFSVTGFGTVITGTLWQGSIRVGDRLMVEPGSHTVRVRNVQVHSRDAEVAHAGQRTAVAVHGVEREEIPRGSWLVAPDSFSVSSMFDVRIRVLADTPKAIRRRQRVRFHLGASEVMARVVPLEFEELPPGSEGLAQIRLETPALARRGDRFVIRSYSPSHTIAGGTVISANAKKRRLGDQAALDELKREETGSPEERIQAALDTFPLGSTLEDLAGRAGLEASAVQAGLQSMDSALVLEGDQVISRTAFEELQQKCRENLEQYQQKFSLRWGMPRGDLKSSLGDGLSPALFQSLLDGLAQAGEISLRQDWVRFGGEDMELDARTAGQVERLTALLTEAPMTPPILKELQDQLGFNPEPHLEFLVFEGKAVKISPDLYYDKEAFVAIGRWLEDHLSEGNTLAIGELREALGMSRKYSVPVLEAFDSMGWTRRQGDRRTAGRRLGEGL